MEITTTADLESFLQPCFVALGIKPGNKFLENTARLVTADRSHVAIVQGRVVGSAGAYSHSLAVPGGTVNAAGVFGVGVLPSHRRRGILTKLQEVQLMDVYSRGEALAYLWASEGAIYERFGYGVASLAMRMTIDAKGVKLRGSPLPIEDLFLASRDEARVLIPTIYDKTWINQPGMFSRDESWWNRRFADPDFQYVVWEDKAYAIYLVRMDSSSGSFMGEVEVMEAVARSVEGYRRIWEYLLNMDLVYKVGASYLPVDHPLRLMLNDLRKANCVIRDGIWLRIIDVEAAIRARAFGDGSIVIRLRDARMKHNDGIWRIANGGIARSTQSPELSMDISDLGSIYLGGFSFSELHRSGRVEELVPGSIARGDKLFSWDCEPWCPEPF